jgi:type I restriction enzyme, S subunit
LGYIDGQHSGSIKNVFHKGDVLFGKLRPYLKKYLLAPFDGVCSSEIWVLKSEEGINEFLYYLIQSDKFIELTSLSSGSKMPRADWNVVSNGHFYYPSLPEQQKIASFLTAVDDKIQQLSKKKALLEQYKKGVMQQLFSQQLRFEDDQGNGYPDWEEKMLGEVGDTFNGLTGMSKENFGSGLPYITYKQIFDSAMIDVSKFEFVDVGQGESQNLVKFGDVFFTTSSETANEIGYASVLFNDVETLYLNSFCFGYRIRSFDSLSPYYAKYLFRSPQFRIDIQKLAQGSTRYNMSKVGLMKVNVNLPSSSEQTKIANFLSVIDDKINGVNQQIEHTRQFKKGLLQQMFV